ncbi:Kelch-like protein 26 [Pseudolycoriella hygida]|uniref:Kelch-like protein diablo n=1 Tax=Pseudolycoriella hygida TaxID=35572 RepID=A0A9Q0N4V4_9DIPT|nr:Kelch-like protein 26 [Pseudolycoriella hygida]
MLDTLGTPATQPKLEDNNLRIDSVLLTDQNTIFKRSNSHTIFILQEKKKYRTNVTMTGQSNWTLLHGRALNTICFESQSHPSTVLQGFNGLRSRGFLLDITLLVEGKSFRAHRAVLAAVSDYFRAMFTDAMKESTQSEIKILEVSARGMELILNYAYTSKIELDSDNILDVLSAASYVQIDAVVEACTNFLTSHLDLENCVDLATISETFCLEKLRQKCYRFICANLSEFAVTEGIKRLTWQQLNYVLSCDFPVDCKEEKVFKIVLEWIYAHKIDIKICHTLLNNIRLSDILMTDLESMLRRSRFTKELVMQTKSFALAQRKIRHTHKSNATFPITNNNNVLTNYRGMELALVNIGGFRKAGITNEITYYLPSVKKWHHLTSIPHVEQCNYGTAVRQNELYIVGGCYNVYLKEYIHPFGFRYNPISNKWFTIAPMQQDRCRFSLNFVGKYLYAIGGVSEVDDLEDTWYEEFGESNSERYDPDIDRWRYIPHLPEHRTQHAAASWLNYLYVCGGLDRSVVLSTMWRYDTMYEKWDRMPNMLGPRADHVMLEIDEHLYVCGGWYEENQAENRRLATTIDKYDPESEEWKVVTTIPTPKYHAGIIAVETKIYIIGGFYADSMFDRASSTIEFYDIVKNEWSSLDRYPQNNWECSIESLYIPKFRDDIQVQAEADVSEEATASDS